MCKALAKYGLRNWDRVTRLIPYRTPKAVQNRWTNYIGALNSVHFKNMRKKYEPRIKEVTDVTLEAKKKEKEAKKLQDQNDRAKAAMRKKMEEQEAAAKKKQEDQAKMQEIYNA